MPKPVFLMTVHEAHMEYNSLIDQIWAKYELLDSGECGSVGTPAFNAEFSELAHLMARMSELCITAVGSFMVRPRGFPLFRRVQNYGYAHEVRKTLTSCQQNPILFGRAGLTTPTRLGSLFWLTFPVTSRRNGNYDSNTKCKGCRYGSDDSSRCRLHGASDAINSIITQRQLYLTRKTVGTSRTVPGEHTVGQTWLTVQLAVSSQRTASRSGWDFL